MENTILKEVRVFFKFVYTLYNFVLDHFFASPGIIIGGCIRLSHDYCFLVDKQLLLDLAASSYLWVLSAVFSIC